MTDQSRHPVPQPFDKGAVARHRRRAARLLAAYYRIRDRTATTIDPQAPDFLSREIADRLRERLDEVNRRFELAIDLDSGLGQMADALAGHPRIGRLLIGSPIAAGRPDLVLDDEMPPLAPAAFDLVISCLGLQWVNDLPGLLAQIRQVLKPDGLFLAALIGGDSLRELRQSFLLTESSISAGAGPHVAPLLEIRDAGALLQRAGFALPMVDVDNLTFQYKDPFALMRELRGLGLQNPLTARRKTFTGRHLMQEVALRYHADWADPDGRIPATFQILFLTAWAPDKTQPKPLKPGSGEVSLDKILTKRE